MMSSKKVFKSRYIPVVLGVLATTTICAENSNPNVIIILADDLGIGDLGCYGQKVLSTPAIDVLANNGMQFTNHYSGSTVSAPSRCVLMTGKHTGNAYIRGNRGRKGADGVMYSLDLPNDEVTIAEALKKKNYQTACFGKWGFGSPTGEGHPNEQGFDHFFGYLSQDNAHTYYPNHLFENKEKVYLKRKVYSHDFIMDKAISYIEENAKNPFFVYLAPTLPHAELIVPDKDLAEFKGKFDEKPFKGGHYCAQSYPKATYAAMVKKLDNSVARIVSTLKKNGVYDNTIIIFTSDNGVHSEGGYEVAYFDSNSDFRGSKRDLYDGGIRTPMLIQWPAKIKKGTVSNHLSAFWDLLPTIENIVDIDKQSDYDGISILPTLLGKKSQKKHDALYFEFHEGGTKQAIIKNTWKLIRFQAKNKNKTYYELYNLEQDKEENENLVNKYPKQVKKLIKLMDEQRTESKQFRI